MVFVPIRTPSMFHESIALLQLSYASICRWPARPTLVRGCGHFDAFKLGGQHFCASPFPTGYGLNIFKKRLKKRGIMGIHGVYTNDFNDFNALTKLITTIPNWGLKNKCQPGQVTWAGGPGNLGVNTSSRTRNGRQISKIWQYKHMALYYKIICLYIYMYI